MEIPAEIPASFELAKELTLQLIALSTGIIGVTATFSKDISSSIGKWTRRQIYMSWICFLISIVFGLLTLGAMTGVLAAGNAVVPNAVYSPNIRCLSILQWGLFLAGVGLLILHAIRSASK